MQSNKFNKTSASVSSEENDKEVSDCSRNESFAEKEDNRVKENHQKEVAEKKSAAKNFCDASISPSSKSSEDFGSSKDFRKLQKGYTQSSEITSPINFPTNATALGPYSNAFIPNLPNGYPFLHASQFGALNAVMNSANPYSYLGSSIHPSLFQAFANVGSLPNSSRIPQPSSVANAPFSNSFGSRNYSHALFNSPQTLSALNAYANLFPYNAITASGYSAGVSNSSSAMDLNGRPLSPLSLANRMYRNSAFGKITSDVPSSHHISGISNSSSANPGFSNGFTNGLKSRFSPYSLPPRFNFSFRPPLNGFMSSDDLQQSAFCRQRKTSSSTSPMSPNSPIPPLRTRTVSNSSDCSKNFNNNLDTPPVISSTVQELKNMESMIKCIDKKRQFESKHKVNPV